MPGQRRHVLTHGFINTAVVSVLLPPPLGEGSRAGGREACACYSHNFFLSRGSSAQETDSAELDMLSEKCTVKTPVL